MPAATAAAEPAEEPPEVWSGLWGFAVRTVPPLAKAVVTVLPSTTAPSRRACATAAASVRGRQPAWIGLP
jgi:hypothetical protein